MSDLSNKNIITDFTDDEYNEQIEQKKYTKRLIKINRKKNKKSTKKFLVENNKNKCDEIDCDFKDVIDNNIYVTNCKSNKKKDINSLSYLIDIDMSQSDCIKMGVGVENILREYILKKCPNLKNIKKKNKKGKKERDHLFKDKKNKIIYYAELKSNINLDTEKSKSTYNKCLQILEELKEKHKDYTIKMFLLSVRHFSRVNIPNVILSKYKIIEDNLVGMNEYFDALSITDKFKDENEYKKILNYLAKKMFLS
jgi:hypothetical protein